MCCYQETPLHHRCGGLALLSCFGVRAMHCFVKKVGPTVCCEAVLCASVFVHFSVAIHEVCAGCIVSHPL